MNAEANTMLEHAAEALHRKQYVAAEALQGRACELLREQGNEEARLATELETLAGIHFTQNKLDWAANDYEEVVQIRKRISPANDFSILRPLSSLATVHFEDRKYDLAEAEMREALAMAQTYSDASETMAYCLHE